MSKGTTQANRLDQAIEVIRIEAEAISSLAANLRASGSEGFDLAVTAILACSGQVVVTGMGKAGLVGQKISATLASTGTPSLFLHPAEALHGDLGRIRSGDVLLALSNSGETREVNDLVPVARRIGAHVFALTGRPESTLGKLADGVLEIGRVEEACPLKLAPTASTTVMLVFGDALAMVVLEERGFERTDYAQFHPAGSLGRRLMSVSEVMRKGSELPTVERGATILDVLRMTSETPGRPGAAIVLSPDGSMAGIFTDGDLRRLIEQNGAAALEHPVDDHMATDPKFLTPDQLAEEAMHLLAEHRIDQAPVLDPDRRPVGLVDIQDLMDLGL
ncbi:MAG TPA: KpsF/GutQ family sugar-phosphate isomerase [Planctomycetes bacterium]|nr:KpsF/GutQ family sugar-phosphate isomerase [Planctomycetota bacterium]HIL37297.1 KpsF/GutQ family sugar-phosphate isomerase [Planctomycetota bacterium]